jgi:hypothetical protein
MIKEANSKELRSIEYLAIMDHQIAKGEGDLKARLKTTPDGWRQYRMARTASSKAIGAIYDTLPTKTLNHLLGLSRTCEAIIRVKPIARTNEVQVVPEESLKTLVNIAIKNQCAICMEFGKNIHRCKLRQSLMLISPPKDIQDDGRCPYSDIALQNDFGDYI